MKQRSTLQLSAEYLAVYYFILVLREGDPQLFG